MPLKKSHGNMYEWVTHMHTHLAGECPHRCRYCYVGRAISGRPARYKGEPRLIETELDVDYGFYRTIFIEHMNDMFANEIKTDWIYDILRHCRRYPMNTYVFQTKNPERAYGFFNVFPRRILIGTTRVTP